MSPPKKTSFSKNRPAKSSHNKSSYRPTSRPGKPKVASKSGNTRYRDKNAPSDRKGNTQFKSQGLKSPRTQASKTQSSRTQSSKTQTSRTQKGRSSPFPRKYTQSQTARDKMGGEQVEGRRAVLELLIAGTRRTREIFMLSDIDPAPILKDIQTIAETEQVPVHQVSKTKFFQMAHTDSPQGVIAKAQPLLPHDLENLVKTDTTKPFLLVADGVMDTGNLGNLMRSAECAGVTGFVLGKHRSAKITPATAKAAAGAIEHIPISLVANIPSALERLKELGVWTLGLDETAPDLIYDTNIANEPMALVIGAENSGLGKLTKKRIDDLVSIPLQGKIQSLNAAVAAAVACFEIQRLRRK